MANYSRVNEWIWDCLVNVTLKKGNIEILGRISSYSPLLTPRYEDQDNLPPLTSSSGMGELFFFF